MTDEAVLLLVASHRPIYCHERTRRVCRRSIPRSTRMAQGDTKRAQMSDKTTFVQANSEYDNEQIKASTRQAQSQATENPGFVFVNYDFENNDDEKKKTSRKLIRSKATAYSHRFRAVKHEVSLRTLKNAEERQLPRRPSAQLQAPSSTASSKTTKSNATSASRASTTATTPGTLNVARKSVKRRRESPDSSEESQDIILANMRRKRIYQSQRRDPFPASSDRSLSPGAFETVLPDLTFMDASMRDPFLTYPVKYRSWYGKLISYWYTVVLPRSTRVIKASPPDLAAYTIWSRKQELSEPVLFYTSLFLASGIPVAEGLFPVQAALWLRQKTVQAMQDALADQDRATSIPVILAVGRIALHEHIYGNRQLAHTMHRPAQLR